MIKANMNKEQLVIAPIAMTNSQTASATFDLVGCDYATLRLNFASEINTNAVGPTISLTQADTSNSTAFATVVADRTDEDRTAARQVVYGIDLKSAKRYGKLSVSTGTTTNDNVTVSADLTLSRLEQAPSSTTGMVVSTTTSVVVLG